MTAPASRANAESAWLQGPLSDVLFGAGALYLVSIPLLYGVASLGVSSWPIWLAALIALLVSGPHYGATLLRVYERADDRRRYAIFAVWITLALIALTGLGAHSAWVGSLLITAYVTWSPWHFAGQNYGIALLFLRRRDVAVDARAKRLLYASFVLSALLSMLVFHGGGAIAQIGAASSLSVGYGVVPLGIPAAIQAILLPAAGLAYAVTSVGSLWLLRRAAVSGVALLLLVMATQAMWFVLPAFLFATGEARPLAFAAIWVAGAHALQYLWVTGYYSKRMHPGERRPVYFGKALAAGAAYTGVPALLLAPGVLGSVPFDAGLAAVIFAATNLHHFILDGAIWKLRDGRVARVLLRSEAGEPTAASSAAWVGLLAVAIGVGCLCISIFDVRQRSLAATADANTLLKLNETLRVIGRESPVFYLTAGAQFEKVGEARAAKELYRRSIALYPSADAWALLGRVRLSEKQNEVAIDAFERALVLQPQHPVAMQGLAVALLREDRPQEALQLLEALSRVSPDAPLLDKQLELARERTGLLPGDQLK